MTDCMFVHLPCMYLLFYLGREATAIARSVCWAAYVKHFVLTAHAKRTSKTAATLTQSYPVNALYILFFYIFRDNFMNALFNAL